MQSLCKRLAVALSLAALLAYLSIANAKQYLCVADKSVGFAYNKVTKTWDNSSFSTDAKYLLRESKDPKYAYEITRIGDRYVLIPCAHGFWGIGYLYCKSPDVYDFKFNKRNGRFLLTHAVGYYNVLPEINKLTDENSATTLFTPICKLESAHRSSKLALLLG